MNTPLCELYANPDEGTCAPGCPFHIECDPFFEEIAKELEAYYKAKEN